VGQLGVPVSREPTSGDPLGRLAKSPKAGQYLEVERPDSLRSCRVRALVERVNADAIGPAVVVPRFIRKAALEAQPRCAPRAQSSFRDTLDPEQEYLQAFTRK
jgi:hypothetical protein